MSQFSLSLRRSYFLVLMWILAASGLAQAPQERLFLLGGNASLVELLPASGNEWVAVLQVGEFGGVVSFLESGGTPPLRERPFLRQDADIAIVRYSASGEELARVSFGGLGYDRVVSAFLGRDGRVTIVGNTDSPDFPAIQPLFPEIGIPEELPHRQTWGFVLRTNAALTEVETATLLGGTPTTLGVGTQVHAAAVDNLGSLYITGTTSHADLPVSQNAWKPASKLGEGGKRGEGFLLKLRPDLQGLVFGTFFGADEAPCPPETAGCTEDTLASAGVDLSLGPGNQPIVLHGTTGWGIPVTPGQVDRTPDAPATPAPAPALWNLYLTRFSADGSAVAWTAGIGPAEFQYPVPTGESRLLTMNDGSLLTLSLEPEEVSFPNFPRFQLSRWSADASALLAERPLLRANGTSTMDVAAGFDGRIRLLGFVIGDAPSEFLQGIEPTVDVDADLKTVFATLNGNTLATERVEFYPVGDPTPRFAAVLPGGVTVFERFGQIHTYPLGGSSGPVVIGITRLTGRLFQAGQTAAYDFLTVLGLGLAPGESMFAEFDRDGNLPTELAGVSVRLAGQPSPLLRVGSDSIDLVTPPAASSSPESQVLEVEVFRDGEKIAGYPIIGVPHAPNVMQLTEGSAPGLDQRIPIVIREDGSLSTMDNPVEPGEVVSVYIAGAGLPTAAVTSGKRVDEAMPWNENLNAVLRVSLPVRMPFPAGAQNSYESEVLYFGTAPGFVAGTIQANIKIPEEIELGVSDPPSDQTTGTAIIELRNPANEYEVLGIAPFQIWIRKPN